MRRPPRDLPADLELPLGSGREWWYWTGGSVSIDLVNTLRERWRRRVECLCSPDDLHDWLVAAGMLRPDTAATAGDLTNAIALREAVDALIVASVGGHRAPDTAIDRVNAALSGHRPPRLEHDAEGVSLTQHPPVASVPLALTLVARDAAALLGGDRRRRVRICDAPDCSARFYDRSPAGARRWCSTAGCGNRANVRAHRRRTVRQGAD